MALNFISVTRRTTTVSQSATQELVNARPTVSQTDLAIYKSTNYNEKSRHIGAKMCARKYDLRCILWYVHLPIVPQGTGGSKS